MTEAELIRLLNKYAPEVGRAFMASVSEITSAVVIERVVTALRAGDVDAAMDALRIETAAFRTFQRTLEDVFEASATLTSAGIGARSTGVVRFDLADEAAQATLRSLSSGAVTAITEDQRTAARLLMTEGLARGDNPRRTALELVGRLDAATGERSGGIIGLTDRHREAVKRARQELLTGDKNYLTRKLRDKRFDGTFKKAVESGKPVSREFVEKATAKYRSSLLRLRGETIARTETLSAMHSAQHAAYRQAVDKGEIREQDVRKVWKATFDGRTRDTHAAMDGESVGLNEPFSNGLMYPGDPSGDPAEIINCRCVAMHRVDFLANV